MLQVIFKNTFEFQTKIADQEVIIFGETVVNESEGSLQVKINYAIIDGSPVNASDIDDVMIRSMLLAFHQARHEDLYDALGIEMDAEDHAYIDDIVLSQMVKMKKEGSGESAGLSRG